LKLNCWEGKNDNLTIIELIITSTYYSYLSTGKYSLVAGFSETIHKHIQNTSQLQTD